MNDQPHATTVTISTKRANIQPHAKQTQFHDGISRAMHRFDAANKQLYISICNGNSRMGENLPLEIGVLCKNNPFRQTDGMKRR
jgi:hypothetical protein